MDQDRALTTAYTARTGRAFRVFLDGVEQRYCVRATKNEVEVYSEDKRLMGGTEIRRGRVTVREIVR